MMAAFCKVITSICDLTDRDKERGGDPKPNNLLFKLHNVKNVLVNNFEMSVETSLETSLALWCIQHIDYVVRCGEWDGLTRS